MEGNTYRTGAVNANCSVQASFVIRPFEADISGLSGSLAEGTSGEFVINTSYANGTVTSNITVSSGESSLTLTKLSETSYRYIVAETDRDRNVTLSWTAQDGADATRQVSGSLSIKITNTSFTNQLANIQALKDNTERLLSLSEEKRLVTSLKDVVLVLGSNASLNTRSAQSTGQEIALASAFDLLSVQLTSYLAGQNSDTALQTQFDDVMARLNSYAVTFKQDINAYFSILSTEGMTPVSVDEFYINAELGTVSLLIGNTQLGNVREGAWGFNDNVAYLDGLLSNTGCYL